MEFIDLQSILKDSSIILCIPNYFNISEYFAKNKTNQLGLLYLTVIKISTDLNIDSNIHDS